VDEAAFRAHGVTYTASKLDRFLRSTGAPFRGRGRAIQELTETHSPALFEMAGKSDW
jgi:hypothetical protein